MPCRPALHTPAPNPAAHRFVPSPAPSHVTWVTATLFLVPSPALTCGGPRMTNRARERVRVRARFSSPLPRLLTACSATGARAWEMRLVAASGPSPTTPRPARVEQAMNRPPANTKPTFVGSWPSCEGGICCECPTIHRRVQPPAAAAPTAMRGIDACRSEGRPQRAAEHDDLCVRPGEV